MRNILTLILSIALLLVSLKAVELGWSARRTDVALNTARVALLRSHQNLRMINQANKSMTEMFDSLQPDAAPCDTEGFELLEDCR